MSYLSSSEFVDICYNHEFDVTKISAHLIKLGKSATTASPGRIQSKIDSYRRKGLLPLNSGNTAESALPVKSISTLYDSTGKVKSQRITSASPTKQLNFDAIEQAITELTSSLPIQPSVKQPTQEHLDENLANLVLSTDVHMGLFATVDDSAEDWDTDKMVARLTDAYDYLFSCIPKAKTCIIVDLGDSLESPDNTNKTRKSGHSLDVSNKHARNLRAIYESFIYAITKALETHELVYFYNIEGNHEVEQAIAIREVIRMVFKDNPRVIVNEDSRAIKYHQHGSTLLQFFHGDQMKPIKAGEVMAHDCHSIFSSTQHRFSHHGHFHIDSVRDGSLCKVEGHRHLAPSNTWSWSGGHRRGIGTMKAITYHTEQGEISRNIYNVQ